MSLDKLKIRNEADGQCPAEEAPAPPQRKCPPGGTSFASRFAARLKLAGTSRPWDWSFLLLVIISSLPFPPLFFSFLCVCVFFFSFALRSHCR